MRKDQVLTIETFNGGEDSKYLISSPKEIQLILQAVAKSRSYVIMYFAQGERFLKTILLGANEQGIWLDVSPSNDDNNALLHSDEITLVTLHQGAKVQFVCHYPIVAVYASNPAFFFALPPQMIRLQRREYFRLSTSMDAPLKCMIPPTEGKSTRDHEITIMDISVGGIQLSCAESGVSLLEGEIYENCRIELPGVGTLLATVQVKNLFDLVSPSGKIIKHAGCEFMQMDGKQTMMLQRYIGLMQSRATASRTQ